jgi:hypothetical protein
MTFAQQAEVAMSNQINARRRRFLGTAVVSVGAMESVLSGLARAQIEETSQVATSANTAAFGTRTTLRS